jgi:hypothetical protein
LPSACGSLSAVSISEALDDVLGEFGMFISGEIAATQVAIACLRTVEHGALETFEASLGQAETRLLGVDVPGGGWIAPVQGLSGARALVAEMAEGGDTHRRLRSSG